MKKPQPKNIKVVVTSQTVENSEGFYVRTFVEIKALDTELTVLRMLKKDKHEKTNNNKTSLPL